MRKDVTPVSDRARPRATRAALVVGALIGAVALAGCGAGQVTQTASQVAAVEGGNATTGQIAVRNATIEFDGPVESGAIHPAGGEAPLEMSIVNTGAELDRLVGASSPVASSVQVSGVLRVPGGQVLSVEGAPAQLAAPQPTDPAAAGGTPGPTPGEASTPGEAAATPPPTAPATTPAPEPTAAESTAAGSGGAHIVLTGLREDIQAGRSYPVVLTFERAGDVQVEVPVAYPDVLREDQPH